MNILVLNAGSASLKFDVIAVGTKEDVLDQHRQLISAVVENIGKETTFSLLENKQVIQRENIMASDYQTATRWLLNWWMRANAKMYQSRGIWTRWATAWSMVRTASSNRYSSI